jgi:small subunit ribosomal protein S14
MKYLVEKDKKRRQSYLRVEWKRVMLKVLLKNSVLSLPSWHRKWKKFSRFSCPVKIRNRCQLTGRGGSIYRRFHLSRMALREEGNRGNLVGVKRSSW